MSEVASKCSLRRTPPELFHSQHLQAFEQIYCWSGWTENTALLFSCRLVKTNSGRKSQKGLFKCFWQILQWCSRWWDKGFCCSWLTVIGCCLVRYPETEMFNSFFKNQSPSAKHMNSPSSQHHMTRCVSIFVCDCVTYWFNKNTFQSLVKWWGVPGKTYWKKLLGMLLYSSFKAKKHTVILELSFTLVKAD